MSFRMVKSLARTCPWHFWGQMQGYKWRSSTPLFHSPFHSSRVRLHPAPEERTAQPACPGPRQTLEVCFQLPGQGILEPECTGTEVSSQHMLMASRCLSLREEGCIFQIVRVNQSRWDSRAGSQTPGLRTAGLVFKYRFACHKCSCSVYSYMLPRKKNTPKDHNINLKADFWNVLFVFLIEYQRAYLKVWYSDMILAKSSNYKAP